MLYALCLYSQANKPRQTLIYIGFSNDLQRRIKEHQGNNEKIELIYYEAYQTEELARTRERKLKQYGSAWRGLKKRLELA